MALEVTDLGLVPYDEARALQLRLLEARVCGEAPDTLLLLEHPPVVTLGRGTDPRHVPDGGRFPVVACERGGDVTLHAPGQLVGYLVRLLPEGRRNLHAHLRLLEEIVIRTLARFEVESRRVAGLTGVWVGDHKIASLGVACRHWCTWHGLALNVDVELGLFEEIKPCGLPPCSMTSLERELGKAPPLPQIKEALSTEARSLLP